MAFLPSLTLLFLCMVAAKFGQFEDHCEQYGCQPIEDWEVCNEAIISLNLNHYGVDQLFDSYYQQKGCWVYTDTGLTAFNADDTAIVDAHHHDLLCYCPVEISTPPTLSTTGIPSNKQSAPSTLPSLIPTLSTPTYIPSTQPNDYHSTLLSTSSQPLLQYIVNNANTNRCDPVTQIAPTEEQCKEIADSIAIWSWRFTWESKNAPSGCYLKDLQFIYYNYHQHGESDEARQPICYENPNITGNPSLAPSIYESTKSPSQFISSVPSIPPSILSPSNVPSSSIPSTSPTTYCSKYLDEDVCHMEGCVFWNGHCQSECHQVQHIAYSGTLIGGSINMQVMGDCERLCLLNTYCVRYTWSHGVCSQWSSYTGEYAQHGSISGICKGTNIPTEAPTNVPSISPSQFPTMDCSQILDEDICRRSFCSWSQPLEQCNNHCEILGDLAIFGVKIGEIGRKIEEIEDCEKLCLEENNCIRFSYSHQICSLFSSFETIYSQHGTQTGICHHTLDTFKPTLAPTNRPTESPTSECNAFFDKNSCRQSQCAWLVHENRCSHTCTLVYDIVMVGEMIRDPVDNGGYFKAPNMEECEILCLEHKNCVRFSYSTNICSLYKDYQTFFQQHGVVTGICVHTEIPTPLPTHSPIYIPTHQPSSFPTKFPSTLPTSAPEETTEVSFIGTLNMETNEFLIKCTKYTTKEYGVTCKRVIVKERIVVLTIQGRATKIDIAVKDMELHGLYLDFIASEETLQIIGEGECNPRTWLGVQPTVQDCWNEIKSRSSQCDQTYFIYVLRGDRNCGCVDIGTDCTNSNNIISTSSVDIMKIVDVQTANECVYRSLGGLAANEGIMIGGQNFGSLEIASSACDGKENCNSFSFCDNSDRFYLFATKIEGNEAINPNRSDSCETYYKSCPVTPIHLLVILENSESEKDLKQQQEEDPILSETRVFFFMVFLFLLLLIIIACYAFYRCYRKNYSKKIVVGNVMEMVSPMSAFVVRNPEIPVVAVPEEFKFEKEETLTLPPCLNTLGGSECPEGNSQSYLNQANSPRIEVNIPITLEGETRSSSHDSSLMCY